MNYLFQVEKYKFLSSKSYQTLFNFINLKPDVHRYKNSSNP